MTLTVFLLARIAEDEAVAQQAIQAERPGTHWGWFNPENDEPARLDGEYEAVWLHTVEEFPANIPGWTLPAFIISTTDADGEQAGAFRHIARWDPARVLAECEAKRRVVGMYRSNMGANFSHLRGEQEAVRVVLRALAAIYSGHPDYCEEWS